MVDKKLLVTLVLDCCFSGSVVRYDNSTRFVEYDSTVAEAHRSVPGKSLGWEANRPIHRDAIMLPRWLVDPDRYTILAACGPREIAREISDEHKRKVGALSFFLSNCMGRVNGLGARQQNVYGYLSVRMREFSSRSGRQQTPMLYDNKYLSLFGVFNLAHRSATIQIMRSASDTLQLITSWRSSRYFRWGSVRCLPI
ncbi:hypothetical protein EV127DRAFT_138441 [Xylaria flabelliformis]|nr:hypothetical protein EV127DRAFT_138441 [Xylaria flabelliformis]